MVTKEEKRTEIRNYTTTYCDFCNKEVDFNSYTTKCIVCGKDVCINCGKDIIYDYANDYDGADAPDPCFRLCPTHKIEAIIKLIEAYKIRRNELDDQHDLQMKELKLHVIKMLKEYKDK
jgi:hypothetical protein